MRNVRPASKWIAALLCVLFVLFVGPAVVSAEEMIDPQLEGVFITEDLEELVVVFKDEFYDVYEEFITIAGMMDGQWYDVPFNLSFVIDQRYVYIYLEESAEKFTDFQINFEPGAVWWDEESFNIEPITALYQMPDIVKDLYVSMSSFEVGDVVEVFVSFRATEPLITQTDYIDLRGLNYTSLDSDAMVTITVDGVTYEVAPDPSQYFIRLYVPVTIEAGQRVDIFLDEYQLWDTAFGFEFPITTSVNTGTAYAHITIVDNSGKHPHNVQWTPITANGEETTAYPNEMTSYELSFSTSTTIEEGYVLDLWFGENFGLFGDPGFLPSYLVLNGAEAEPYVDIVVKHEPSVTEQVYKPVQISADQGNNLMILPEPSIIPADAEVKVLLHDIIVNPLKPAQYVIWMQQIAGQGDAIQIPVMIAYKESEPQSSDPQIPTDPSTIGDLELHVSNLNGYYSNQEIGELYFFGNGQNVTYTFTGTATSYSDEMLIVLDEQYLFRSDEEFQIKGATLRVNGQEVPIDAALDGYSVYVYAADSSTSLSIKPGDAFELQLIMDNPENVPMKTSVSFELNIGEASGVVTTDIVPFIPSLGMMEPYAGISQAKYVLLAYGDMESPPFSTVAVEFPPEVELPGEIMAEHIIVYAEGADYDNGEPKLELVHIAGQAIYLVFDQPLIGMFAIFLPEAGIPTPEAPGSYEYRVSMDQSMKATNAVFTTAPERPDPKALNAEIHGLLNIEVKGIGLEIFMDQEVELVSTDVLHTFGLEPVVIEFEYEGVVYDLPLCFTNVNDASIWMMVGCGMDSEIELEQLLHLLQASTEAYITFDNDWVRHPAGSFSEGKQRVKIMTEALIAAIASKLTGLVPEGQRLDVGMLVKSMHDEELMSLFGGELDRYDVERLLEYIEPKYIGSDDEFSDI